MGRALACLAMWELRRLGVALAIACIVVAHADSDAVVSLEGDSAEVDLAQGEARPTDLSSSSSFAGTASSATIKYNLNAGGEEMGEGLQALKGERLMGEGSDAQQTSSRVNLAQLQGHLEAHADMMGKMSRMAAINVIMGMPPARVAVAVGGADELALVQVAAGATVGWGRRRRGSAWQKKNKKVMKPKAKPVAKTKVVKKKAKKKLNKIDESKVKADKAINMAREKGIKARKKADKEEKAARDEAMKKKKLELAQKRRHEITKKTEKVREKKMKVKTERADKKAKEAAHKAEQLQKAIARAKEMSKKEQVVEKKTKKAMEIKGKKERELFVKIAREKAAKNTKEIVMKKKAEVESKFQGEQIIKRQKEKKLKQAHEVKKKKAEEKASKKAAELARKTAEEARQKNAREKALKARQEKIGKAIEEKNTKAAKERKEKAIEENNSKVKREKALKAAAQRRINEEKRAKAVKRKAMARAHEQAAKKAQESAQKRAAERKEKVRIEVETKKTTEKREKKAREVTKKKAMEIVRKVHRELQEKIQQEKTTKKYLEQKHKEKKKKAHEKIAKALAGLKSYMEKLKKSRAIAKAKRIAYHNIHPREKKMKTKATHLSNIAKELARKIKGKKKKPKIKNKCDLGDILQKLKKKGVLSAKNGKCSVNCTMKPSDLGITATCQLAGKGKKCRKLMYVRSQTVASTLVAAFDSFKNCKTPAKKGGKEELGESMEVTALVKNGIAIGEYIYALKSQQDEEGNVNAGEAIDMLLKCNRDGKPKGAKGGKGKGEEFLGESDEYSPQNSKEFNASAKGAPKSCGTAALKKSMTAITARPGKGCEAKCKFGQPSFTQYTAECSGSGKKGCFIAAQEAYHRQVIATYYGWKAQCARYH